MSSSCSSSSRRVWFVTGAGRGLGRAFVVAALHAGDRVVATVRRRGALDALVRERPDDLRVLHLDVRDRDRVVATVHQALCCFGRVDVVVNNAGYGLVGAAEEVSENEAREQLDTNFSIRGTPPPRCWRTSTARMGRCAC